MKIPFKLNSLTKDLPVTGLMRRFLGLVAEGSCSQALRGSQVKQDPFSLQPVDSLSCTVVCLFVSLPLPPAPFLCCPSSEQQTCDYCAAGRQMIPG